MIEPNGISLCGTPIDLTKVSIPVCVLSTREDHIAPWKSTYAATQTYKGPVKFILAASGHIAGVVNHPDKNKYHHSINTALPETIDEWKAGAEKFPGSWWPHWLEWLNQTSPGATAARTPGDGKLEPLEDAPGSYVKVRAPD